MRYILTLLILCAGLLPAHAQSYDGHPLAGLTGAAFAEPTARYDHGILGDAVEWGALAFTLDTGERRVIRLPETRVFEDISPRLIRGDRGQTLAMVVESDLSRGARLALYGPQGLYAATPFIGQPHRWLAPVAAGDLDGDGAVELAYVDRPHLAKTLRVWRLADGRLTEVAALEGVSNHKIGWDFIAGGQRDCGQGPEMVLASGDWREVVAVRLTEGRLERKTLGPLDSLADIDAALACR
ncbi:VCBS repeat-containing protein [Sinisalibacter aestuarii]|uniref:VCBS repeat-containing protein n=1 Tax=Sinisalibacter aestuarii TaxID=2949426 RepID=A0ABQ5LQH5_9RHOB|nr:VCBS repeat-containing protein [Sinisalibacter aestuarii]GKY87260.1 hypothetical protein STA1M1_11290 [Sinisalibacter aestuarii]